jgi:catechol 2,3-dioxygenase-like lactoylglutathione lyase family enzyme
VSSTDTTVSKLASVIVPVTDQDRQLELYTEVLGLEKRADVPFGPGRWIEVAPSGAETPIAMCPPGPDAQLKARGVDVGLPTCRELDRATLGLDHPDKVSTYTEGDVTIELVQQAGLVDVVRVRKAS